MSELAQAMRTFRNLGLNVIKYPSGKFGFVGHVPFDLAFVKADGSAPTPDEQKEIAQSSNPAWTCKALGVKSRVWDSEQDARETAAELGYEIVN